MLLDAWLRLLDVCYRHRPPKGPAVYPEVGRAVQRYHPEGQPHFWRGFPTAANASTSTADAAAAAANASTYTADAASASAYTADAAKTTDAAR